jgi:hypothetical protein
MARGLIEEIQGEALDASAAVGGLLRKVKVAAAKLKLARIEQWVDHELKGYGGAELPGYRILKGGLRVWSEYHGWQPVGGDPETLNWLSTVRIGESIASLEALAKGEKGGGYLATMSPDQLAIISKATNSYVARAGVDISRGAITHIIESVRTLILEWAIALENEGIMGEGLSFTSEERTKAQNSSVAIHIASIGTFTGNLGTGNTSGDITSAPLNVDRVRNLVSQIRSQADNLANEGVETTALASVLERIEAHLAKPNESLLRKTLVELQAIITDAAGGLVSTGALALLHQLLGTGVPG